MPPPKITTLKSLMRSTVCPSINGAIGSRPQPDYGELPTRTHPVLRKPSDAAPNPEPGVALDADPPRPPPTPPATFSPRFCRGSVLSHAPRCGYPPDAEPRLPANAASCGGLLNASDGTRTRDLRRDS